MSVLLSGIGAIRKEQLISSCSNGEPNWSFIPTKGKSSKTQTEFVSEIREPRTHSPSQTQNPWPASHVPYTLRRQAPYGTARPRQVQRTPPPHPTKFSPFRPDNTGCTVSGHHKKGTVSGTGSSSHDRPCSSAVP